MDLGWEILSVLAPVVCVSLLGLIVLSPRVLGVLAASGGWGLVTWQRPENQLQCQLDSGIGSDLHEVRHPKREHALVTSATTRRPNLGTDHRNPVHRNPEYRPSDSDSLYWKY